MVCTLDEMYTLGMMYGTPTTEGTYTLAMYTLVTARHGVHARQDAHARNDLLLKHTFSAR